ALPRQDVDHRPAVAEIDRSRGEIARRQTSPVLAGGNGESLAAREDVPGAGIGTPQVRSAEGGQVVGHERAIRRGERRTQVELVGEHRVAAAPPPPEYLA